MSTKENLSKAALLRHEAEDLLKKQKTKKTENDIISKEIDTLRLIHELEVHQIELELQNEELQIAKNTAQELAKKYTKLYDFATTGLFTLNKDGEILELNISGAQMLGKGRSFLNNSRFGLFVSDDTKPVFNHFLSQVFMNKSKETYEVTLKTLFGLPAFVELTGIVSDDGENCLLSVRDISDRKKAEIEKLEMQKQMMDSQKLETIGILAGGIALNLNHLLTTVLSNLEQLSFERFESTEVRSHISNAKDGVVRVSLLTKQLMAYSGTALYDLAEFDVNIFMKNNLELFKASISKNIQLEMSLHDKKALIKADESQLKLVFMNLLSNASDAIGDKNGVIKITTGIDYFSEEILHNCLIPIKPTPGNYFFIKVSDDGCGMDQQTIHKMFEPFFTTKLTGRGLGLSSLLGILTAHHGEIFIDSAIGYGTTFTIIIPAMNTSYLSGDQKAR